MTPGWFGSRLVVLGTALAIAAPLATNEAEARVRSGNAGFDAARAVHTGMARTDRGHSSRYTRWSRALQCVPFARENTGIELTGNANTWWRQAEGVYERGAKPEVGSILSFRATGRMRLGHVAVVSKVTDSRNIEIDQANWSGPGRVTREITVVDVSPNNDWTAVRVELGNSPDGLGSVYPTYGFIYDRPDSGIMLANSGVPSTPASNDLRLASGRITNPVLATATEEVAEAPDDGGEPAPRAYRNHSARPLLRQASPLVRAHARSRPAKASVYRASSRGLGLPTPPHPPRRQRS